MNLTVNDSDRPTMIRMLAAASTTEDVERVLDVFSRAAASGAASDAEPHPATTPPVTNGSPPDNAPIISATDMAKRIGVAHTTVLDMMHAGLIPQLKAKTATSSRKVFCTTDTRETLDTIMRHYGSRRPLAP